MNTPNLFNQLLIWPIINLLVLFYVVFSALHLPGALGWSIIALTILIRLALYPLMSVQLRSAKKMAELKPHLDRLNQQHKNDKQRLQQEQMRLFKEAGVNPAAGCLPMLIQLPVLLALYNVFFQVLGSSGGRELVNNINSVVYFPFLKLTSFNLVFFGVNLGVKPSQWQTVGPWILVVPVITALLQFVQTKTMTPPTPQKEKKKTDKEEKPASEDMSTAMQTQMTYFTPILFGYFAFSFPLGLALYWNTFTVFGIIQQVLIAGWGGMTPWLMKFRKQ